MTKVSATPKAKWNGVRVVGPGPSPEWCLETAREVLRLKSLYLLAPDDERQSPRDPR
jgi:hypothetical protein